MKLGGGVGLALLVAPTIASGALAAGCTAEPPPTDAPFVRHDLVSDLRTYATDPAFRRAALEKSLVVRDNGYAALRLANYDEEHWGALPVFEPRTAPVSVAPDGSALPAPPATGDAWTSTRSDDTGWSAEELRDLGERAFFTYPVQAVPSLRRALDAPDHAGVWSHDGRYGAVWLEPQRPNGVPVTAYTCASCHASVDRGRLVAGRNNPDLDAGRIAGDGLVGPSWGPGRVDVTPDDVDNPVAITDLRPVRWQTHLHHTAEIANDPIALAVRIETLMITSSGQAVRPPRKLVAALTVYLLSLAPTTPRDVTSAGAAVFERTCASCHRGDGATGPAVPLEVVGTDPLVGRSPDRGTGSYRVPSLRSVGDRRRLFASGAVEDVADLLDPARKAQGHRYGLDLPAADRAALLSYLRTL
jgi:mono/diheme cytochrome c family protein